MRTYYILGALILGIVLLYLYTNNIEPFANNPVTIYANIDSLNNITFVGSTDNSIKGISAPTKELSINFGEYKKIQKIVSISSLIANNGRCGDNSIQKSNPPTCWGNFKDIGSITVKTNKDSKPANDEDNFNFNINPKNPIVTFANITYQKFNLHNTKGARSVNIKEINRIGNIKITVILV